MKLSGIFSADTANGGPVEVFQKGKGGGDTASEVHLGSVVPGGSLPIQLGHGEHIEMRAHDHAGGVAAGAKA